MTYISNFFQVLNIKLREHNKADFLKYVLNFDYEKKATAPKFIKYLNDVLDEDTQKVLQEFAGYIFINHLKLEKSLYVLEVELMVKVYFLKY